MLHKSDYISGGIPLINPINIVDGAIVADSDKQVGIDAAKRLTSYVLRTRDIVVGRRGEIGRCAVVGPAESGWVCGTGCFFIRPKPTIDSDFLAHLLRSPRYREMLERASTGATMKNMSNAALSNLPVSMPTAEEQRRIVTILDEAFEGIATAKANAEKNLQNARLLLDSQSERLFAGSTSECPEQPLEAVASIVSGFAFKSSDFIGGPGLKCIKITNVGVGEFVPVDGDRLPFNFAGKYGAFAVANGSIVLALTRTIIGAGLKVAVVPEDFDQSLVNQRVAAIVARRGKISPDYLFAYLRTRRVGAYVRASVNTLMQPNLSIVDLRRLIIPVPPVSMQERLVESLALLAEQVHGLASVYQRKLNALNELKQSLLHQAFSGHL